VTEMSAKKEAGSPDPGPAVMKDARVDIDYKRSDRGVKRLVARFFSERGNPVIT